MSVDSNHFDVVTVPDFTGSAAPRFEIRALFFLAAWLEYSGQPHDFPLHLACIGEPPPRVAKLAERVGARITVHQPLGIGVSHTANKLRGLDIPFSGRQRLLLDTDILVLGDLSALKDNPGPCLAAAPVFAPRWPRADWPAVYAALGEPMPEARILCTMEACGIPPADIHFAGQTAEFGPMPPMYNTGVLWIPAEIDLRASWEDYLRRTRDLFPDQPRWRDTRHEDQVALTAAVHHFMRSGLAFRQLPSPFHAAWPHLWSGQLSCPDIRLFHAFGFGSGGALADAIPAFLAALNQNFEAATGRLPLLLRHWTRARRSAGWRHAVDDIGHRLQHLYSRHLEEL